MKTKRWKRTIIAKDIWRWNGKKDGRGRVRTYTPEQLGEEGLELCVRCGYPESEHGWVMRDSSSQGIRICPKQNTRIIYHADNTYEVITNAEFDAQGWEEDS